MDRSLDGVHNSYIQWLLLNGNSDTETKTTSGNERKNNPVQNFGIRLQNGGSLVHSEDRQEMFIRFPYFSFPKTIASMIRGTHVQSSAKRGRISQHIPLYIYTWTLTSQTLYNSLSSITCDCTDNILSPSLYLYLNICKENLENAQLLRVCATRIVNTWSIYKLLAPSTTCCPPLYCLAPYPIPHLPSATIEMKFMPLFNNKWSI